MEAEGREILVDNITSSEDQYGGYFYRPHYLANFSLTMINNRHRMQNSMEIVEKPTLSAMTPMMEDARRMHLKLEAEAWTGWMSYVLPLEYQDEDITRRAENNGRPPPFGYRTQKPKYYSPRKTIIRKPHIREGDTLRIDSDENAGAGKNAKDKSFKCRHSHKSPGLIHPFRTKGTSFILKPSHLRISDTLEDFDLHYSEPTNAKGKKVMTEPIINSSGKNVVGRSKTGMHISESMMKFQVLNTRTISNVLEESIRSLNHCSFGIHHSDLTTTNNKQPLMMEQDKRKCYKKPRTGCSEFDDTMSEGESRCSYLQHFFHDSPVDCSTLYSELTTTNEENPVVMEQDTLRVLLLGKTGSGKSSLGDNLLGEKRFSKFRNLKDWIDRPESKSVQAQKSRFGRHINIVDTPGIFNTGHTDLQVANAIRKCILLTKPGPHAIILVVKASRLTKEDIEVFKTYTDMFGESMFKHTIVVFTHFDHWKQIDGKTKEEAKEEFIRSLPETLNNVIQNIQNRYIMLDTKGTDVENATKALIFGIEQMVKDNENGFYPCEHVIGSTTSQLRAERIGADENRCQKKRKNGRQLTRSFLQKNIKRARSSFESETDASMITHFKRSYNGRA